MAEDFPKKHNISPIVSPLTEITHSTRRQEREDFFFDISCINSHSCSHCLALGLRISKEVV